MCLLQYGQSDQLAKARSYAMPRKTRGEKGRQRCSSVESEEPLDEARSLASWLQLPRESLVLKCNTHNLRTRGKKAELAARLKSFFEENHHQVQDTSMADNDSPSSTPNPTQAISVPAASPIIQSIMPGIAELITKHLSQLPASTFQSQPGSSKDPNYSSQPCNKAGANPGQERTSSGKGKRNARLKRAYSERSHSPSPVAKNPRSKPASKSASKRSPLLSSLEVSSGSEHSSSPPRPKNKKPRRHHRSPHTSSSDSSLSDSPPARQHRHSPRSLPRHCVSSKTKRSSSVSVAKPPPLPPTQLKRIKSCEYIDFDDLLSSSLYAPASARKTTYEFDVSSKSQISLRATRLGKPQVIDFGSWLEAWNNFLCASLYYHPSLCDQMLKYQVLMSEYAFKYRILQVLSFDVAVRRAIATDPDRRSDDRHQTEFDKFLAGHLLPSCYSCNRYGHYSNDCPLGAGYSGSKQQPTFPTTKKPSPQPRPSVPQPQSYFRGSTVTNSQFCSEFNKAGICNLTCPPGANRCNRHRCGGLHPGFQCPFLPKYKYATPRAPSEPVRANP